MTKAKTKGKGKEKEQGTLGFFMLEYLQRFASYEPFDFKPIYEPETVEEPFSSLECIMISLDYGSWENACDTTSSNAIAGPSRVTLDDLDKRRFDKYMQIPS